MNIEKYVFKPTVENVRLFFLINQQKTYIFVMDEVVNTIQSNGLTDATFIECKIAQPDFFKRIFN